MGIFSKIATWLVIILCAPAFFLVVFTIWMTGPKDGLLILLYFMVLPFSLFLSLPFLETHKVFSCISAPLLLIALYYNVSFIYDGFFEDRQLIFHLVAAVILVLLIFTLVGLVKNILSIKIKVK